MKWLNVKEICYAVISGADDRVAKSDGGDVGGTWLQLMCCALPKICVLNLSQRVRAEVVRGGQSWVRGVILESDGRGPRSDRSEDES